MTLLVSALVVQAAGAHPGVDHPELTIVKTAETNSYLVYGWEIEKSVDRKEIALTTDPTGAATYTVAVVRDDGTEYGWQVFGDITITNNTDNTAEIVAVSDTISGQIAVDVSCEGPGFPLELGPDQTLNCHYGPVSLPDGVERTNTATVHTSSQSLVGDASHTVDIDFDKPLLVNDTIMVVDDYATPDHASDDIWWEFGDSASVTYQRSYGCKDAGNNTNTASILVEEIESIDEQNVAADVEPLSSSATVAVSCDTSDPGEPAPNDAVGSGGSTTTVPVSKAVVPNATTTDLSCLGANAKRGSRGDSSWSLIGPKGHRTTFFLSKRSYWRVLGLKNRAKNPYFRLGAAYTMVRLHHLNGTSSTPAVEKAMKWTLRYLGAHRAGYSKLKRQGWSQRNRIVKRLQRVMRRHARVLERYAAGMDASRCIT